MDIYDHIKEIDNKLQDLKNIVLKDLLDRMERIWEIEPLFYNFVKSHNIKSYSEWVWDKAFIDFKSLSEDDFLNIFKTDTHTSPCVPVEDYLEKKRIDMFIDIQKITGRIVAFKYKQDHIDCQFYDFSKKHFLNSHYPRNWWGIAYQLYKIGTPEIEVVDKMCHYPMDLSNMCTVEEFIKFKKYDMMGYSDANKSFIETKLPMIFDSWRISALFYHFVTTNFMLNHSISWWETIYQMYECRKKEKDIKMVMSEWGNEDDMININEFLSGIRKDGLSTLRLGLQAIL